MFRRHALLLFVGGILLCTPLFSSATTTLGISPEKVVKPVIRTLDSGGDVGAQSSIAIGRDGNPVVAYIDSTNFDLKFFGCADTICSSGTSRTLDSAGSVGSYSSITIGNDGNPVISYYDGGSNRDLKVYVCSNVSCSSGVARTLDSTGNVGYDTSIAIGRDGFPVISYFDTGNQDLKFYACSDASCSSGIARTLDSTGLVGYYTSIVIGRDGNPVISYLYGSDLRLYACSDTTCSAGIVRTINSADTATWDTSVTLGRNGYPIIAYFDSATYDLKLYACNDATCSTGSTYTIVSSEYPSNTLSVAIGRDGYPVVLFHEDGKKEFHISVCKSTNCATGVSRKIAPSGQFNEFAHMTIGRDGVPVISYYDEDNGDLKFAYVGAQVTLNKTPPPSPKTAGGLVGWWTFDGKDLTTTTATDRSGLGNNGTLVGTIKPVPKAGRVGQGLLFNLSGGINAGSAASLDNVAPKTLTAWVKRQTGGVITGKVTWMLQTAGSALDLQSQFSGGNGHWTTQSGLPVNTWVFATLVYDNSSSANVPTFYIDGVATTTVTLGTPSGTRNSDANFNFGVGFDGSVSYFSGTLDDVRIYNRILTAQEIKDLYNQTKGSTIGFMCGRDTVRDADGNAYHTVKIGTQCWMKENLRVGTRIDVTSAQANNSTVEKYCYNDNSSYCTSNHPNYPDGGIYQWDEAMQYSTASKAQGICPRGWHIPSHDEFTTLERAVCTSGTCATDFPYDTSSSGWRGTNEGTKLKASGSTGFEANLAGYSHNSGYFSFRSSYGYIWSSTQEAGSYAWVRVFDSGSAQVERTFEFKVRGRSVRCLKN